MRPETPIIGLLLAIGVFISLFTLIFDVGEQNNVTTDLDDFQTQGGQSFYDSFNKFNQTKNELDDITTDFENTKLTDTGSIFSFLGLGFRTLMQVFQSLDSVKDVFESLGMILSVDPMWISIFTTILVIMIILMVIFVMLGRSY